MIMIFEKIVIIYVYNIFGIFLYTRELIIMLKIMFTNSCTFM